MKKKQKTSKQSLPPCKKRKRVDGFDMCYAIGCCEIGDMYCECPACPENKNGKCLRRERERSEKSKGKGK